MATTRLGVPIVIALFVTNLATSSKALQSSLLSSLAGNDKSPVLMFLDNSALSKAQSSNRQTDLAEVDVEKSSPLLALLSQLTQAKDRSSVSSYKENRSHLKNRNRKPRYHHDHDHNHDHEHRHRDRDDDRSRYDDRNRYDDRSRYDDRNRYDDDERDRRDRYYNSRQQGRSQRGRYRTYRDREDSRYRRPLRSDDKQEQNDKREPREERREQQQENREEKQGNREEQPRYRAGSAQAQIPVIRSILRTLNCNAKDECQDECQGRPAKNKCEDECEIKYECEDEEPENDSCDDTCTTTKSCTVGGSTRGVTLEPGPAVCPRCK